MQNIIRVGDYIPVIVKSLFLAFVATLICLVLGYPFAYIMAKAKGSPKTGGRKAGTPNKTPKPLKVAIAKILEQYNESGQMEMDFNCMGPLERIKIAEKLMQYVVPKIQSVAVDVNNTDGNKTIEDRLRELSQQHDKAGK